MKSQDLLPHLPYLRRFARAVTGDQGLGDRIVRQALNGIVEHGAGDEGVPVKLMLFRAFLDALDELDLAGGEGRAATVADRNLRSLTPMPRMALLLSSMEGFANADIAWLLGVTAPAVERMIGQALDEVEEQIATRILIIEDEPIIALDLQSLVEDMRHTVVGNARTKDEALAMARAEAPGLILADIQLADRSSGIDAVNEILHSAQAPVIFITAFPERLLTGSIPEPTYVLTKPFDHRTLKATISQALFFGDMWQGSTRRAAVS